METARPLTLAEKRENVRANYAALLLKENAQGNKPISTVAAQQLLRSMSQFEVTEIIGETFTRRRDYFIPADAVRGAGLDVNYWERLAQRPPVLQKVLRADVEYFQMPASFRDTENNEYPNNFITELEQLAQAGEDPAPVKKAL